MRLTEIGKAFETAGNPHTGRELKLIAENVYFQIDGIRLQQANLLNMELERAKQSSALIREQMEAALKDGLMSNRELA